MADSRPLSFALKKRMRVVEEYRLAGETNRLSSAGVSCMARRVCWGCSVTSSLLGPMLANCLWSISWKTECWILPSQPLIPRIRPSTGRTQSQPAAPVKAETPGVAIGCVRVNAKPGASRPTDQVGHWERRPWPTTIEWPWKQKAPPF